MTPSARFLCSLTLALATALPMAAPSTAQADSATTQVARERFQEGVELYDQRQFEKARLAFLQAYALKPHPAVLLNLAQSELRGGHTADAATHFNNFLLENSGGSPDQIQEAELGLAAASSKVGVLKLTVDKSHAEIFVDGESVGRTPLASPIYLETGAHKIEARSGNLRAERSATAVAGEKMKLSLTLTESSGVPAAAPSSAVEPEETVLESDEDPEDPDDLSVSTGGRRNIIDWYLDTPLAWYLSGGGLLALGGAGFFAVSSETSYHTANDYAAQIKAQQAADSVLWGPTSEATIARNIVGAAPGADYRSAGACGHDVTLNDDQRHLYEIYITACDSFNAAANDGDNYYTTAVVLGVVGGLAIGGTVAYYFIDPAAKDDPDTTEDTADRSQRNTATVRVIPVTSPDYNGISILGRF